MELRTSVATSMLPVNWASPSGRSLENEIIRLVGGHKALSCLPQEDLRALLRQSTVVRFGERERIFSQGSEGRHVLLVVQGYVKLSSNTAGGREVVLELAGPGSVFGELAVLNGWRRAADAYALSPCQLVSMEARLFTQTLSRMPEAMLGLMRIMSRRLQRATEQMTDAGRYAWAAAPRQGFDEFGRPALPSGPGRVADQPPALPARAWRDDRSDAGEHQ